MYLTCPKLDSVFLPKSASTYSLAHLISWLSHLFCCLSQRLSHSFLAHRPADLVSKAINMYPKSDHFSAVISYIQASTIPHLYYCTSLLTILPTSALVNQPFSLLIQQSQWSFKVTLDPRSPLFTPQCIWHNQRKARLIIMAPNGLCLAIFHLILLLFFSLI